MLFLFDMDGTLITNYMDNPDRDYHQWSILPGRKERIRDLINTGNTVAIITNQGGVAFGFVSEIDAMSKLDEAQELLGIKSAYVCFHDTRGKAPFNDPQEALRRKPNGTMIREAIADHPEAARFGVLMVGDRPEDEQAARDAEVPFRWSHIFFGD